MCVFVPALGFYRPGAAASPLDDLFTVHPVPPSAPNPDPTLATAPTVPAVGFAPCYVAPWATNLSCRRLTHPPLHDAQNLVGEWAVLRGLVVALAFLSLFFSFFFIYINLIITKSSSQSHQSVNGASFFFFFFSFLSCHVVAR